MHSGLSSVSVAVARGLRALSALSFAAMIAGCSSPSYQGKSVSALGEVIEEEALQDKALQDKAIQGKSAAYRSLPTPHPKSGLQADRSTGASVGRQPAPHCELPGLEPDTIDADVWSRMKLDYEQHCYSYKQAAMLVRTKARGPAEAIIRDAMRDKVQGPKAAVPNAVAPTDSGVAVPDTAAAPTVTGPTSTGTVSGSSPPLDAKFYRVSAIGAYRNGDLALALVDFDRAIRLDPSVEDAYIDRGIILYRLGVLHAAFDDVARARRIENSHRILTPPLPKTSPLPKDN